MALKLTLKPNEKIIINGAVITNGPSKCGFSIENTAVILRDKDIMLESEADSPAKRIYFCVMMAYLDDANRNSYLERFNEFATDFIRAVPSDEVRDIIVPIGTDFNVADLFTKVIVVEKFKTFTAYMLGEMNS